MKKNLKSLVAFHSIVVTVFGLAYLFAGNYEFLIYLIVILVLSWVIWISHKKLNYPITLLWALSVWTLLHLAAGIVPVGDEVLYRWMVWTLSDSYPIIRFDQVVHAYGFGTTAFLTYYLIKPLVKVKAKDSLVVSMVIVLGALGFGTVNEILEFTATVITPETGVGGYINTSLDMVSNLFGALIALFIIRRKAL